MSEQRIADLRRKLAARTGADGKALPGYAKNVEMIQAEIKRLEEARGVSNGD